MSAKKTTIEDLLFAKSESMGFEALHPDGDLQRAIEAPEVSSPGLLLAGYTERFAGGRLQVLGETEMGYLASLSPEARAASLDTFFSFAVPAVIVAKGLPAPDEMVAAAARNRIPLLRTKLKTGDAYRRLHSYLQDQFAPSTTLHGSMADVYGVGLLFVGKSGIGKSECVLDLVERGHRLVADDVVHVTRRGNEVLLGRGHELQRHHMEIRGIGIIDIPALFGIRAIRQQKRIEVVVQLEEWNDTGVYERTGLETDDVDVLGVTLPKVTVPLNPGKNITVISEVVAMNHLLKYSGVHSAALFDQRLREAMRPIREYLEEDYE